MDFGYLVEKNPWWRGKESFSEDEDFRKWQENPVKWLPKIMGEISFEPFSMHIITGPRQAGKTTAVKLLIRKLLQEKTDPKAIFYFRCDTIKDYRELLELLNAYLGYRDELGIKTSYFFLDEITMPDEWFRAVKELIDSGKLKKDVVVLTGSTSMEIKKNAELFPGRRGNGHEFALLPLSFREYLGVLKPGLYSEIPKLENLNDGKAFLKALPHLNEANKAFSSYLQTGGFPLAILSHEKNKFISEQVKLTYLAWIKNDLHKAGKDENIAKEILKAVITKIPSKISWDGLSKEISVKSPKTVNSYLHTFQEMFLAQIIPFLDPNTGLVQFGKNKKIAFIDPLIYQIIQDWSLTKIKDLEPALVEGIVSVHLAKLSGHGHALGDVFYWSNGSEIDALIKYREKLVGFEVKWQENVKAKKIVIGKMKDYFILSKKNFDPEKNIIPVSLFLAMIE